MKVYLNSNETPCTKRTGLDYPLKGFRRKQKNLIHTAIGKNVTM